MLVVSAAAGIGVVDGQLRLAAHIAVDDEIVGGRPGLAEKGVHGKRRAAVRVEMEARARHGENVAHAAVDGRDETRVLEALEIDERRLGAARGHRMHDAFVGEQIVAAAEIAGQPRLEDATRLIVEKIVLVAELDVAGDDAGRAVGDRGARPVRLDGEQIPRRDGAGIVDADGAGNDRSSGDLRLASGRCHRIRSRHVGTENRGDDAAVGAPNAAAVVDVYLALDLIGLA